MPTSTQTLDLHPIVKSGKLVDQTLREALTAGQKKRLRSLTIIPGKGSGQLMKRVKRFLDQASVKEQYHRYQVNPKNHGTITVYFR